VGVSAPIRVLIADDDEGYLESLEALIERQPELTVVAVARDGQEAVDLAASLDPEAVVIDLHMPRVGGVEAVNRLRSEHPSLCLIALTGDSDGDLHRRARAAGADGVFLKGQLLDNLLASLARARRGGDGAGPTGSDA
jgi:two-component system response regulator DesR